MPHLLPRPAVGHFVIAFALLFTVGAAEPGQGTAQQASVTVTEGTSMSVAVSPDGRTLAIDLQGGIWTLPASGGVAKRVTDEYNDAREPVWSPDGKWIAFQGYRDGGWDIWAAAADGSGLRQVTSGPYDDREPAWSHDGAKIAFSSDRADAGNYNVWVLDVASGQFTQVTSDRGDDYMPTWGPGDRELAFVGTRSGEQGVYAVTLGSLAERRMAGGTGRADAPSWGPGGTLIYYATSAGTSRLEIDGNPVTGSENAFAFKASWASATEFYYVSDGKIRKRSVGGGAAQTVEFSATLNVTRASYTKRRRDFDSRAPRKALGIVRPDVSPDGKQVAFAAVGDIYMMAVGSKPQNLTNDMAFDTDPAWSPDGAQLAYSSDKSGALMDLWIRDMRTGTSRQVTNLPTSALGPTWSPDAKRIAFLDVDGIWGRATPSVLDLATGTVTKLHDAIFAPGNPTWSADGKRIALAAHSPYSARFREGMNKVLTFSSTAGASASADEWFEPTKHLSIDSRVGGGPAWSRDGTRMAVIYEGLLSIVPVGADGAPSGPPRRVTQEMAHSPSWTADGKQVLYQSMDKLRMLNVETGVARDVPVDLTFTPAVPSARVVVHAGQLFDGTTDALRQNVDIIVVGNRIRSVAAHSSSNHTGAQVVDGTGLTAMPGLIEHHAHLQKDFGSSSGLAYLAWGVTTMRSPGGSPYESVEYKEAVEAGVRPGPHIYSTGYLMEWNRVYYNMAVAVSSPAHLDMEMERAKVLGHDLIKSYVRMPDLMQKRIVEFAHAAGIPVSSHEVYPSSLSGIDMTEHMGATSRRGFSPKQAPLQATYEDVIKLFAASGQALTPTFSLGGAGLRRAVELDPSLSSDPRFALYPSWLTAATTGAATGAATGAGAAGGRGGRGGGRGGAAGAGRGGRGGRGGAVAAPAAEGPSNAVVAMMRMKEAGVTILAGTDTPNAANLHGELRSFVDAGMTPFEALQTATVNPARMLSIDAGSIEVGKLADILLVDGNPLADIGAAHRVRQVIANGRVYTMAELLKRP
ncbi:MAG: amidohydrolase family protein [Gemmatimonadetes bacterium]|nr:amidohydrolase family protein [Gemmatimonadota bacterium]